MLLARSLSLSSPPPPKQNPLKEEEGGKKETRATHLHVERLERDQVHHLRVVPLLLELRDGLHDHVAHPRVAQDRDVLARPDELGLLEGLAVVVRVGLSLDVVEEDVLEKDDLFFFSF